MNKKEKEKLLKEIVVLKKERNESLFLDLDYKRMKRSISIMDKEDQIFEEIKNDKSMFT